MKRILSIDPGNVESGYVMINEDKSIIDFGVVKNDALLHYVEIEEYDVLIIEMFASYGMPVGKTSFDTVVYIGMLMERYRHRGKAILITRFRAKMMICKNSKAKDKHITMACKDHYQPYGGGKDKHKGTKGQPGPLYGFTNHIFAALALALAHLEGVEQYEI